MKYIISATLILLFSCNQHEKENGSSIPASDLAHIDLILDTATWTAVKNDSYMQKEFGVLSNDTAYYGGKPSYDLYLLGQLNFLHLSQAKAFWNNQRGGGVLVFQTQKPGLKDSLLNSWKQFYKDSLFVHTYKGSDFKLDEIMAWYKTDSTKPKEPSIFANLTTYSADAYKNWGITDSIVNAGLAMKQFMSDWGGKELENKLFNSITELHMTINQKEFTEIRSALLATGYIEDNNKFSHEHNPTVFITVSAQEGRSKYSKVKFSLTRSVETKEIVFSPFLTLKLNGSEAQLLIN
ncbi:MAG: DUF5829 family protein [Panacibacter sp.]